MRVLPVLFAAALFASPAMAEKSATNAAMTFEKDTYRFGDLYRSERGTTVEACAQMCNGDSACAAWSLTPASFQIGPRCELKRNPGAASHRPGAASGMSEYWQMDPARHGEMRYQTTVPASRQPAAVPLDQLRPSPVPRTFGTPPPVTEPELLGAPTPRISATMRPSETPPPPPTPAVEQVEQIVRGPGAGEVPAYVKQPAPTEPHPLYKEPVRRTAAPISSGLSSPTFKDPARTQATQVTSPGDYNAVLKRQVRTVAGTPPVSTPMSQPQDIMTPPSPAPRAADIPPPPPAQPTRTRLPWTERDGTDPIYSVGGGFIPGDEDATAGFVEGVPEESED